MANKGAPINNGIVQLRGVNFPVSIIHDAMHETGGVVVGDEDLNRELDSLLASWRIEKDNQDGVPEAFLIERIPLKWFVPKPIRIHHGRPGTSHFDIVGRKTKVCLWFAVDRIM